MNPSCVQFRALLARQESLHDTQCKRLARKIHDDISQKLTALALQMSLDAPNNKISGAAARQIEKWSALVVELGQSVREITNELQPRILSEFGLVAGLQWYAQSLQKEIPCSFITTVDDVPLTPESGGELFRACREIVSQIFRPLGATRLDIDLDQTGGGVRLRLHADTGKARRSLTADRRLDIFSIQERLRRIHGEAKIGSTTGPAITITLCAPAQKRTRVSKVC